MTRDPAPPTPREHLGSSEAEANTLESRAMGSGLIFLIIPLKLLDPAMPETTLPLGLLRGEGITSLGAKSVSILFLKTDGPRK